VTADSLIKAARAWDALRRHAGAAEGSAESRRIARDVMSILCGADAGRVTATLTATGNTDSSGQGPT